MVTVVISASQSKITAPAGFNSMTAAFSSSYTDTSSDYVFATLPQTVGTLFKISTLEPYRC